MSQSGSVSSGLRKRSADEAQVDAPSDGDVLCPSEPAAAASGAAASVAVVTRKRTEIEQPTIFCLPDDALREVLLALPLRALIAVRRVCRQLRALVDDNALWHAVLRTKYPALLGPHDTALPPCREAQQALLARCRPVQGVPQRKVADLHGHTDDIYSLSFADDGALLASGAADHTVRVWDIATQQLHATLTGHRHWVLSVAFSPTPHATLLASGGCDGAVRLWDAIAGRSLSVCSVHSDQVGSVCFTPRGDWLLSGSDDRTLQVWDVPASRSLSVLSLGGTIGAEAVPVYSVAASEALLAAGTVAGSLCLWERRTLLPVRVGAGPAATGAGDNATVAFAPDGRTLAVATDHFDVSTVQLWDLRRLAVPLAAPLTVASGVMGLGVLGEGAQLLLALQNGALQWWDGPWRGQAQCRAEQPVGCNAAWSWDVRRVAATQPVGDDALKVIWLYEA